MADRSAGVSPPPPRYVHKLWVEEPGPSAPGRSELVDEWLGVPRRPASPSSPLAFTLDDLRTLGGSRLEGLEEEELGHPMAGKEYAIRVGVQDALGITTTPSRGHGRWQREDDLPEYCKYGVASDPACEDVYIRPIGGVPRDTPSRWEPRGRGPGVSYVLKGSAGAAEVEDMKGIRAPT